MPAAPGNCYNPAGRMPVLAVQAATIRAALDKLERMAEQHALAAALEGRTALKPGKRARRALSAIADQRKLLEALLGDLEAVEPAARTRPLGADPYDRAIAQATIALDRLISDEEPN